MLTPILCLPSVGCVPAVADVPAADGVHAVFDVPAVDVPAAVGSTRPPLLKMSLFVACPHGSVTTEHRKYGRIFI
jgi:hypothetical protein